MKNVFCILKNTACDVKIQNRLHSLLFFWGDEGGGANISFSISVFQPTQCKASGSVQIDLDMKSVGELQGSFTHTRTYKPTHTMRCVCLCDCVRVLSLSDPACPLSIISIFFFSHRCNGSLHCLFGFVQHHSQTSYSPPPHPLPLTHPPVLSFFWSPRFTYISTEVLLYVSRPARETKTGLS